MKPAVCCAVDFLCPGRADFDPYHVIFDGRRVLDFLAGVDLAKRQLNTLLALRSLISLFSTSIFRSFLKTARSRNKSVLPSHFIARSETALSLSLSFSSSPSLLDRFYRPGPLSRAYRALPIFHRAAIKNNARAPPRTMGKRKETQG